VIAVISHDSGGAEIISSYVRQQVLSCMFVLSGPAIKIFERKLGSVEVSALEHAIQQSSFVICGSSWQSDVELTAIKLARSQGKRSIVFLDHWVNYEERFTREGETILPDEIWVGDSIAYEIAKKIFNHLPVILINNPYLLDLYRELSQMKTSRTTSNGSISVLYVCEPISLHAFKRYANASYWGYVEEDALHYFLSNISVLKKSIEKIVIRPHPSENVEKYNWAITEYQLPIELGGSRSLLEEITNSDVVVGCESMAMVVGLLAGKDVLSCIPPGGRECVLPHKGITSLRDILKIKGNDHA
jgi:hypothetical protein